MYREFACWNSCSTITEMLVHSRFESSNNITNSFSDSNVIWIHNHLVRKPTARLNGWVFVYELSGCGFESRFCQTSVMAPASGKHFLDIQANYRMWVQSETRTWHDNNIQLFRYRFLRHIAFWILNYTNWSASNMWSHTHLTLFDIMKPCSSTIYSERILQCVSIHLKSPFFCRKALISVFNLARVANWSKFLGYFWKRTTLLFLNTSERCLDWIFDNLQRIFLTTFSLSISS